MKCETEKFDVKFLNIVMYIGAFVALFYFLKNIGVMDKIIAVLVALVPIYLGIIICWLSMPLARRLRKVGLNKSWSAIISLVIIFGIVVAMLSVTIPLFVSQMTDLVKNFPTIYNTVVTKVNDFMHAKLHIQRDLTTIAAFNKTELFQKYGTSMINYSISTLTNVVNVVITILTSVVVSFFLVKDMDKFKCGILSIFLRNSKDDKRRKMFIEINNACMCYIKGVLLDSFIVGVLTTIVCMVLRLDYAIVFGILIGILNMVPYIGAILSELIAALYALSVGGPVFAIITFLSLLMVQIIDANILQPNIISKSVDLHPVTLVAGLIVFNLFFGLLGMVIAVPCMAVIKIVFKYMFHLQMDEEEELEEVCTKKGKKLPT